MIIEFPDKELSFSR